jgi:hypothetical protein
MNEIDKSIPIMLIVVALFISIYSINLSHENTQEFYHLVHYQEIGLSFNIARYLGGMISFLLIPFFASIVIYLISLVKYRKSNLWRFILIFSIIYLLFSIFILQGHLYQSSLLP